MSGLLAGLPTHKHLPCHLENVEMKILSAFILATTLSVSGFAEAAATGELKAGPQDAATANRDPQAKSAKAAASARYKRIRAKAHRNAARAKANARAMQLAGESK